MGELKNLQLLLTFSIVSIYAKDIYADLVGGWVGPKRSKICRRNVGLVP